MEAWHEAIRLATTGAVGLVVLAILRWIAGPKPVIEMNMLELTVTFAIGSTLAATMLNENIGLPESCLAYGALLLLLHAGTWHKRKEKKTAASPEEILLVWKGKFLAQNAKSKGISLDQINAMIRKCGFNGVDDVAAVTLNADGRLSAIDEAGNVYFDSTISAEVISIESLRRSRESR